MAKDQSGLKNEHWFKFYYLRILVSCKGWSDEEFGAYIKLLIHQFDKGFIPDNEKELKRIITSYKKSWHLIKTKFSEQEPGKLANHTMSIVRAEYDKKSKKNKQLGSLGGRPKKGEKQKQTVINKKPNGFENETQYISVSNSLTDSKEGGPGETWNTRPGKNEQTLELPELKAGMVIELFKISKHTDVSGEQVESLWKIFKQQNLVGEKFYASPNEVYSHFLNWSKMQKIEPKKKETNFSSAPPLKKISA